MEKIKAHLVIEILGRPAEHIKKALFDLLLKLKEEKGISLIDQKVHEPVLAPNSKDLFTTFTEVSVELDSLANYFGIIFAYMPSHIEITNPEKIQMSNYDLNELGNILVQRLHHYDAITKSTLFERDSALAKLREVAPHLFKKQEQLKENQQQNKKQPKQSKKNKNKKSRKKN